jgi:hypothetical protein
VSTDREPHRVDAAHPTSYTHRHTPSGGITAEYRIFIDVRDAARLQLAAELVLRHLGDWRTFYRRSHIEFVGPEPGSTPGGPTMFKFAPLALWGKRYTGREMTTVTVRFDPPARLPGQNGWAIDGELIDGHDTAGARLPHHFTGPVRTEVRIINEPAGDRRPARVGIEVRDIWVDIRNNRPIPDDMVALMHWFRSADGFGGLRKVVRQELDETTR